MAVSEDRLVVVEIPDALLDRVRSEFVEMPDLNLTTGQAARLWGLDATMSARLLGRLEESGFLLRTRDKGFVRRVT
jgi:hypothetical protein